MRNITKIRRFFKEKGVYSYPVSKDIFNIKVDSNTKLLLLYLLSCSEDFYPSLSLMQKKVNISRPTAIKSLNTLIKHEIISKNGYTSSGIRMYKFNDPLQWYTNCTNDKS